MSWVDEIIPADFTVEHQGQQVAAREHQFFKDAPDLPTFLKRSFDAHREVNRRVPIPNGDSKPEDIAKWRSEHLPKLINAKLVDAPRQAPEAYQVKLPDGVPADALEQLNADPAFKQVHEIAKRAGISQQDFQELFETGLKAFAPIAQKVQVDREAMSAKVKEWLDAEKIPVEKFNEAIARWNKDPRGWDEATAKLVSDSGWADHPLVSQAVYKLMTDSGMFDTRNDGGSTGETMSADEAEVIEIMKVLNDPKHPDYAKFNTADNNAKIDAYWKKKAGGAQYVIS